MRSVTNSPGPTVAGTAVVAAWIAVFAKVGSGLDFGARDFIVRSQALPRQLVTGSPLEDYRNWSLLPLALQRLAGASSTRSAALVTAVTLLAGTLVVLVAVARRRGTEFGLSAVAALFSTSVPPWVMFFMGGYDQLLVVLLVLVSVARGRKTIVVTGALLSLTHAEVGALSLLGLAGLSWADGDREQLEVRLRGLGAVLACRVVLGLWFAILGQTSTRLSFIVDYGPSTLVGHFVDSWPMILVSTAGGGWLLIADTVVASPRGRHTMVTACYLAATMAIVAFTLDESRIAALLMLPVLIGLATSTVRPSGSPSRRRVVLAAAAGIGLALPLNVVWIGDVYWRLGHPFVIGW